ncbi:late control D family protein [Escherichia coli]|nr:late control D family protein [Escherichia coli]
MNEFKRFEDRLTHFLNNSGFTTSLELEVRLSDVEYETEDDE